MTAEADVMPQDSTQEPWDVWKLPALPSQMVLVRTDDGDQVWEESTWITIHDVASDLGISRQAVHRLIQRGTLTACRVGGKPVILVREQDVRKLPVSPQRASKLRLREV